MRYIHHVDKSYRPLTTCDILCRPDFHITTATDHTVTCPDCRAILDGTPRPTPAQNPSPVPQGVSESTPDDERRCAMVVELTEVQCGMLLHFLQHNLDNTRYGLFLHEEVIDAGYVDADASHEPLDILNACLPIGRITEDICVHCGCPLSSATTNTGSHLCNICGGE